MGVEIERKYLVLSDEYKTLDSGELFRQGYLNSNKARVVRIRVREDKAYITIKSLPKDLIRDEFEYDIPVNEAVYLLENICEQPIIEKTRYKIKFRDHLWEVDEFHGENNGLVVAEIELENVDEPFAIPPWVGDEVSHDWRYFNSNLLSNPYSKWSR